MELHVGIEAEVLEHRIDLGLHLPRAGDVQLVMQARQPAQRTVAVIRGDAMAGVVIAREQLSRRAESRGDHVERRPLDVLRHLLLEPRDGHAGLPHDLPRIGRHLAVQELHDRALARAVAPEEAHALAALDREARAVEHGRSTKRDAYVLHAEQCHAGNLARPRTLESRDLYRVHRYLVPVTIGTVRRKRRHRHWARDIVSIRARGLCTRRTAGALTRSPASAAPRRF